MPDRVPKLMRKPYQRRQHPLTRWLSCVLLVLITHGATAELVHRHGGLSLSSAAAESVVVLSGTGESETAKPPLLSANNCLICQFQQHLTHGVFDTPQEAPRLAISPFVAAAISHQYDFRRGNSSRGRAPPATSLL